MKGNLFDQTITRPSLLAVARLSINLKIMFTHLTFFSLQQTFYYFCLFLIWEYDHSIFLLNASCLIKTSQTHTCYGHIAINLGTMLTTSFLSSLHHSSLSEFVKLIQGCFEKKSRRESFIWSISLLYKEVWVNVWVNFRAVSRNYLWKVRRWVFLETE